jgi:uncharacterized protein YkwD
MVNKALLSLAAVVLFAVFGTGVLVGMQVGGVGGDASPVGATDTGQSGSADSSDTTGGSTPASTPASTPDADSVSDREPIAPREFNENNISAAIAANINDARADAGYSRLSTSGTTADRVGQMAQSHSDAMAEAGFAAHTIDGVTSVERYENNNLYRTCQFNVGGTYVQTADGNALEVVGETVAGQTYTVNGTQQFNANETAVAKALTDEWLSTQSLRQRLLIADAGSIGVGVFVNNRGSVYATVNLCS